MRAATLCAPLALLALAGGVAAHVRLHNPANKNPLYWQSPGSIGIVLQADGSDDLAPGEHVPALRNAIAAWNGVDGSAVRLVENTSPAQQARTDWQSSGIHLVLFDETNASGYFPNGSGTVAITPVWFTAGGAITDADVLFNGKGFQFTTSGQPGRFDVQDVAAHELGHLLGLDHTGWAGGTMYPYVTPTVIAHRSLALDEVRGMRHAYPDQAWGTISGTVERASDGSAVRGAHVVARDAGGRTAASALTNNAGLFRLEGLEAGTYALYATPLDHPVSAANLTTGHTIQTDFRTTLAPPATIAAGEALVVPDIAVDDDSALSLGRTSDTLPLSARSGATTTHTLRGSGLVAGSSLQASDPLLTVTPLGWLGSQVTFQVSVPAGAAPGHCDLTVVDPSAHLSTLPAALEIVPPAPTVGGVAPVQGSSVGGTALTITGGGFRAGARVVVGSEVYADGVDATVLDAATIALSTRATAPGSYDVVVLDPSGVEGRLVDGYAFASAPAIATTFPQAGGDVGGTELAITGSDFMAGLEVRIDGVLQPQVTLESASLVRVVTEPGVAGGPYVLEVENPDGAAATGAFSYAAQADPVLAAVTPDQGPAAGGNVVTLTGSGFTAGAEVVFGASPLTGLGGTPAAGVVVVDAGTLQVTAPARAAGKVAVLVRDAATGQAGVLAASYTFTSSGGGGGGGGCSVGDLHAPFDPRDALLGSAWLLLALAIALGQQGLARRAAARAPSGRGHVG